MELKCPYCNSDLIEGYIDSGRYSFKWHDKEMGFVERHTVFGGEVLSNKSRIDCLRCEKCNKIIIDLD
nr:PF20097 family protein [Tissierella sp.]